MYLDHGDSVSRHVQMLTPLRLRNLARLEPLLRQAQSVLKKKKLHFTQGARSENYCSAYKRTTTIIISTFHIISVLVAFELLTLQFGINAFLDAIIVCSCSVE